MNAARSYLFTGFIALMTGVLGIVFLPAVFFGPDAARAIIKVWSHLALAALAFFCGIRHRVVGAENLPKGAAIVAANHQSMWETIALFAILDRPTMVFKKELLSIPIYGWWAKASGVMLDREAGAKAIRRLRDATAARLQRGDQIVIFPEGTRGPPGGLLPLLPGVAGVYLVAEAPVTPVVHNSGTFWRHPGPKKMPGVITLHILPPIPAGLPRKEFMTRLEAALSGKEPPTPRGDRQAVAA
ncbi:MAG: lysophospholipid acyltransferase family protein [Parvularculaceae bacterium]|nr:lysophospholipid acyltransferase family protein [Parvularculaceae bacterium]